MASTVQQVQEQSEVWINTAAGSRWYKCLDLQGRETSKAVKGGRTFTLTTFERQLNQHISATPEQDLFRNGTFVLKRPGVDTDQNEVASPNAMTDAELATLGNELMYGERDPKETLKFITSSHALGRLVEYLVIEGADAKTISAVKEQKAEADAPKERSSHDGPVKTRPEDEFDAVKGAITEAPVKTKPDAQKDQSEGSEGDG